MCNFKQIFCKWKLLPEHTTTSNETERKNPRYRVVEWVFCRDSHAGTKKWRGTYNDKWCKPRSNIQVVDKQLDTEEYEILEGKIREHGKAQKP